MSAHLDLEDVAHGHPKAQEELRELRADRDSLRDALAALVHVVTEDETGTCMTDAAWDALEMARHVLGSKRA
jgi:hypothetical protein